jgi:hypothetical protein
MSTSRQWHTVWLLPISVQLRPSKVSKMRTLLHPLWSVVSCPLFNAGNIVNKSQFRGPSKTQLISILWQPEISGAIAFDRSWQKESFCLDKWFYIREEFTSSWVPSAYFGWHRMHEISGTATALLPSKMDRSRRKLLWSRRRRVQRESESASTRDYTYAQWSIPDSNASYSSKGKAFGFY